jgi:hypothetical protein
MADSWYLFDETRQLGPLRLNELKQLLEVQSLPSVQVWREGLSEWAAPSSLPELSARPPPIPTISPDVHNQSADDQIATKPYRLNNFIAMNWRGEFSLATTYWFFGFLGNLFAGVSEQFNLLSVATVPSDKYADYCATATTRFREISKLPQKRCWDNYA